MSFPDLRAFLDQLHRDNDVVTSTRRSIRSQEAAEIHRRVIAAGGPALAVPTCRAPTFRSSRISSARRSRAELAFGERPLRLIKRLVHLAETLLPPTPAKLWGARDVGLELLKVGLEAAAAAGRSPRSSRATSVSTACRR